MFRFRLAASWTVSAGTEPLVMDAAANLLLLVLVSASPSLGIPTQTQATAWNADNVTRWAAEHAPAAAAMQSERRAVGCGLDRDDPAACAQVGLIQAVLDDLAAHDQNRAAGDALATYYQILAVERQRSLLAEADQIIKQMIDAAERAEQLELSGGNSIQLRQQRLELADQAVQAELGVQKLRIRLAELTGQPFDQALEALLPLGDLPASQSAAESPSTASEGLDPQAAVATALAHRADLRAIVTLCRCTTADSLPIARQLLGVVQPGLGLSVIAAAKSPLMLSLHGRGNDTDDLACRRSQCRQLVEMRRMQIRSEVLRAVVDVQLARRRSELQNRAAQLAEQLAEEARRAVELEQAAVGTDRLAELDALQARGDQLQRWVDQAVADVRLRQTQGTLWPAR